jgi:deoxyribodipyrimidine photo-lyase
MRINIVWFKKDLRLVDNEALFLASKDNLPVILLYVIEPELWQQDDASYRQFIFLKESLESLLLDCQKYNFHLNIVTGDVLTIFSQLVQKYQIAKLYSHQETGNFCSYQRDKKVKKWCVSKQIKWFEPSQNGVIRGLKDRDGWSLKWQRKMIIQNCSVPQNLQSLQFYSDLIPDAKELNLDYDNVTNAQIGGRDEGLKILNNFLYYRGENYSKEMSSPVTAFDACSRISPYLTYGCLSIKEVFQLASNRQKELRLLSKKQQGKWLGALRSFLGRLRWHCHFIQKFEDQPNIEWQNLHPAYDDIGRLTQSKYLTLWQEGKTGFPMIDAAMRALIMHGWINFRMRAMLVSFASNHLWLDWRVTSKYLARLFIDYEAGIHYSQMQMQSGTTGINAIRIYSPTKQVLDHDPAGVFIKKYLPELAEISAKNIANPHNEPLFVGNYPRAIIDEKEGRKLAAQKLYNVRKNLAHKIIAKQIVKKHASRKGRLIN